MTTRLVVQRLLEVEYELRRLEYWDSEPPPPRALASTQPFAVDTLSFPQWLQFIFIPRMLELVEQSRPLPGNCHVAPMAEEYFRPLPENTARLEAQLREIDRLLSG